MFMIKSRALVLDSKKNVNCKTVKKSTSQVQFTEISDGGTSFYVHQFKKILIFCSAFVR